MRDLPSIRFDRHLYQPLLIEGRDGAVKSAPPGLTGSERRLVKDLRAWCRKEKEGRLADKDIYLLRNLSRGEGVGFFETRSFYPDFILWIKSGGAQRIVFVEPHGMFHDLPHGQDEKAALYKKLPEISRAMEDRTGVSNITLDSYIISATRRENLPPRHDNEKWDIERFAEAHILFPEDDDYIERIMT